MTRWAYLVFAIMAADVAVAHADDDAAEVTPATAGETPDAALDAALHAMQPDGSDMTDCDDARRAVVKKVSLGAAGELRVMKVPLDCLSTAFALVFGADKRWWSSTPTEMIGSDCGMGQCFDRTLLGMAIRRRRDRVVVTFRIREEHTRHVPGAKKHEVSVSRQTLVCTLGAAPTCTDN